MPSYNVAMDPVVPPLAADLVETFFFGASLFLDTSPRVAETSVSRGVLVIVCLLDLFHAVGIRASCLLFPIFTIVQGEKGCPIAQEMLCWSCP
jgi:hypothetical protein